jgi:hypothetical protein
MKWSAQVAAKCSNCHGMRPRYLSRWRRVLSRTSGTLLARQPPRTRIAPDRIDGPCQASSIELRNLLPEAKRYQQSEYRLAGSSLTLTSDPFVHVEESTPRSQDSVPLSLPLGLGPSASSPSSRNNGLPRGSKVDETGWVGTCIRSVRLPELSLACVPFLAIALWSACW